MSFSFPLTDSDREWMRRYPGSWKGPLSKARPCFVCREPGYTVPSPLPSPTATTEPLDAIDDALRMRTGDTCPSHEWFVRRALYEHPEWDHLTGDSR